MGKFEKGRSNKKSESAKPSGRPFEAFRKKETPKRRKEDALEERGGARKSFVGKGKKRPVQDPDASPLPRLNQYVAKAGICSRRQADELIATGKVKVNRKIVREMGYRVQYDDVVEYEGKVLMGEELRYVLLNKPKGFLSTMSDEKGRKTVMDLVKKACKERIYPVGRLDRDTTGLLLFTNDGDLAKKLTHSSSKVKKIYHVFLDKPMTEVDLVALSNGVTLEDGLAKPAVVSYVQDAPDGTQIGIQLDSAKNGIVAKMFEHFGYEVKRLDRVLFATLTKKDVPRGKFRTLRDKEVTLLKQVAGKTSAKTAKKS
ncbi:rRNA pseudouridine synthase [Flavobacteriales bacterium]|nr:rRNA pseudouridine synthase [Flavobacteriales bacterium]